MSRNLSNNDLFSALDDLMGSGSSGSNEEMNDDFLIPKGKSRANFDAGKSAMFEHMEGGDSKRKGESIMILDNNESKMDKFAYQNFNVVHGDDLFITRNDKRLGVGHSNRKENIMFRKIKFKKGETLDFSFNGPDDKIRFLTQIGDYPTFIIKKWLEFEDNHYKEKNEKSEQMILELKENAKRARARLNWSKLNIHVVRIGKEILKKKNILQAQIIWRNVQLIKIMSAREDEIKFELKIVRKERDFLSKNNKQLVKKFDTIRNRMIDDLKSLKQEMIVLRKNLAKSHSVVFKTVKDIMIKYNENQKIMDDFLINSKGKIKFDEKIQSIIAKNQDTKYLHKSGCKEQWFGFPKNERLEMVWDMYDVPLKMRKMNGERDLILLPYDEREIVYYITQISSYFRSKAGLKCIRTILDNRGSKITPGLKGFELFMETYNEVFHFEENFDMKVHYYKAVVSYLGSMFNCRSIHNNIFVIKRMNPYSVPEVQNKENKTKEENKNEGKGKEKEI